MKNKKNWLIAATTLVMTAAFLVWPIHHGQAQKKNDAASLRKDSAADYDEYDQDSTKRKRKYNGNDESDEQVRVAEQQVQQALQQVQVALQKLQEVDLPRINETVAKALKSVNLDEIKVQVDAAMKNVDMQKVQVEINKAMADVDMKNIQVEVDKAMSSIDWANMKKEMAESMKEMKNLHNDEIKKAMDEAKREMENARIKMGDAGTKLKKTKGMVAEMKKDGLIDDAHHLNIHWKKGQLYINGKLQPDNVSDKYRKYMEEDASIYWNDDKDGNDL